MNIRQIYEHGGKTQSVMIMAMEICNLLNNDLTFRLHSAVSPPKKHTKIER